MRAISTLPEDQPGQSHLNQMLDCFSLAGPNGIHNCLVLELLGPSVADVVDSCCKDDRLPASLAKAFSRQALQGLDLLARHSIGHGGNATRIICLCVILILLSDIHPRNLAIEAPDMSTWDEKSLFERLGEPEIGSVSRLDGEPLSGNIPSYLVRPARFKKRDILQASSTVRIIDFGEAFFENDVPSTIHTPLAVRAPEAIFGDVLDRRVDLWSAGCLVQHQFATLK